MGSRAIHVILNLLTSEAFYNQYIKLPDANTPLSPSIQNNPKLYPFFKDCQGSIDGTQLDAFVPDDAVARYRNRKGRLSQNVLAACDQEMRFTYILSGWEGSAADGHVFSDARQTNLTVPAGKYFLADAGFGGCDVLLVPYRGERYHLKEWGKVSLRSVYMYYPNLILHAFTGQKIIKSYLIYDMHRLGMLLSGFLV
jgi:hypothetical protein